MAKHKSLNFPFFPKLLGIEIEQIVEFMHVENFDKFIKQVK